MLVIIAKVIESPHPAIATPPSVTRSQTHTHTQTHKENRALVWRTLAHLSLYQTVSPSLQRRCLFEECATVGRMNLHDELGIYLFIFHPAAPRHLPTPPKTDFYYTQGSYRFVVR